MVRRLLAVCLLAVGSAACSPSSDSEIRMVARGPRAQAIQLETFLNGEQISDFLSTLDFTITRTSTPNIDNQDGDGPFFVYADVKRGARTGTVIFQIFGSHDDAREAAESAVHVGADLQRFNDPQPGFCQILRPGYSVGSLCYSVEGHVLMSGERSTTKGQGFERQVLLLALQLWELFDSS